MQVLPGGIERTSLCRSDAQQCRCCLEELYELLCAAAKHNNEGVAWRNCTNCFVPRRSTTMQVLPGENFISCVTGKRELRYVQPWMWQNRYELRRTDSVLRDARTTLCRGEAQQCRCCLEETSYLVFSPWLAGFFRPRDYTAWPTLQYYLYPGNVSIILQYTQ